MKGVLLKVLFLLLKSYAITVLYEIKLFDFNFISVNFVALYLE